MIDPGIGSAAIAWMGDVAGGTVTRAERFVHTRPMWVVDVRRADGSVVELFARGDRGPASALSAVYDLAREAVVVEALTRAGVPTPRFVAYEPDAKILLLERAKGRSDFVAIADTDRRQRIARHFIEVIADLHSLAADSLGLDALGIPRTADDMALAELRIGEALFDRSGCAAETIVTLSRQWLYENVPRAEASPCFVQGDTGPGNFMFEGDRVTHLVDWEIAHFGDPMEDLAAICVRDMVTPFAHLPTLFARYGEVSGTRVDLDRVRYHRVSKCVRSLFAILSFTSEPSDAPEFAIWQAWRLLYIKSACQALAEAMGGAGSVEVRSLYHDAHRQVEAARPAMGELADRAFSPIG
ncbi:MAG TPA: phosphotransferase family protein [Acidimicrobiales bacterium]|nr:phosphotransferase family protein [Acidimicrobiales bacterium]